MMKQTFAILATVALAGCAHHTVQQPDYATWQSVTNGMPCSRVVELLGPPLSVDDGGLIQFWHYGTIVPKSSVIPEDLGFSFSAIGGEAWHKEDPFGGRFSTNGLPTCPVLLFPNEGSVLSHDPPYVDFRWLPSAGEYPMEYEVKVTPGVNGRTSVPHYATDLPIFWAKTQTVHWAVRAVNGLGKSEWSEESSFTFIGKEANKMPGHVP